MIDANLSEKVDPPVWHAFPNNRNAKLLIDTTGNIRFVIHLWHPYSIAGKLSKVILSISPRPVLRLALAKHQELEKLQHHYDIACKVLNSEEIHIHFSTGTPGPHRKMTAQISDRNKIIAYLKIAESTAAKTLIERERDALYQQNESSPAFVELPQVLGWYEDDTGAYLFLSAPSDTSEQRSKHIDKNDIHFLECMAKKGKTEVDITTFLNDAYSYTVNNASHDPKLQKIIEDTISATSRIIGNNKVITHPCHGDYTPWNTLLLSKNNLFVFDWEYSTISAPPLFDLLYRVYMPERLLNGMNPLLVTQLLVKTINDDRFSNIVLASGISKSHDKGYILLFYAWMACRESVNAEGISEYLKECIRYGMIMAEQSGYSLKVLVSAYACEPDKGSEPGVGWNWACEISKHHEAWVITKKNNRESIEKELARNPNQNINFIYADPPRWLTFWKKKERGVRSYYYLWQLSAILPAIRLNRKIEFDIAHHVTFVNDWIWTFLCALPIPYVWGPIGSNVRLPLHLLPNMRDKVRDNIRIIIQTTVRWFDPLCWISVIRASSIMTINKSVASLYPLHLIATRKILIEPAIGIDFIEDETPIIKMDNRVLFVGHHIPIKGGSLAIEAFSKVLIKVPDATLTLIGEGIDEKRLKIMTKALSIEKNVFFEPWQSRNSVRQAMEKASIFLFPSLEAGGMVVLESMTAGTPVVCLDFGGPGTIIDEYSGIKVTVRERATIVNNISTAVTELLLNKEQRDALGNGAKKRVKKHFTWPAKGCIANKLYLDILGLSANPEPIASEKNKN